ncbi:hypothetical protein L3X38_028989 [Prunus dulcis]|uniref:Purple acid phosphatase Fn3-like domain-containing protein n=1 Tax=Prunus dulcis TaxID=3755 RepID=A0AAD4VSS5_PRUDU|nr:hypothetical protein L3X38_028989 [Prunus dulcis]
MKFTSGLHVSFKNYVSAMEAYTSGSVNTFDGCSSTCPSTNDRQEALNICSAPIKYRFANDSNADFVKTGEASLKFQLINQRADFSFALFSSGCLACVHPKLVAVSNAIRFVTLKAPFYPRLA